MKITWDSECRAIYIELPCHLPRTSLKQVEVHGYETVILDYNLGHELVGIEILNADEPYIERVAERGNI